MQYETYEMLNKLASVQLEYTDGMQKEALRGAGRAINPVAYLIRHPKKTMKNPAVVGNRLSIVNTNAASRHYRMGMSYSDDAANARDMGNPAAAKRWQRRAEREKMLGNKASDMVTGNTRLHRAARGVYSLGSHIAKHPVRYGSMAVGGIGAGLGAYAVSRLISGSDTQQPGLGAAGGSTAAGNPGGAPGAAEKGWMDRLTEWWGGLSEAQRRAIGGAGIGGLVGLLAGGVTRNPTTGLLMGIAGASTGAGIGYGTGNKDKQMTT